MTVSFQPRATASLLAEAAEDAAHERRPCRVKVNGILLQLGVVEPHNVANLVDDHPEAFAAILDTDRKTLNFIGFFSWRQTEPTAGVDCSDNPSPEIQDAGDFRIGKRDGRHPGGAEDVVDLGDAQAEQLLADPEGDVFANAHAASPLRSARWIASSSA